MQGSRKNTLPLRCRVRRHGWRVPGRGTGTPVRVTCAACEHVDLPIGTTTPTALPPAAVVATAGLAGAALLALPVVLRARRAGRPR